MKKPIAEMSDAELKQAYEAGKKWLIENEQGSKTDRRVESKPYDPALYMAGLTRIEAIEDEMKRRGMVL